MTDPHREQRHVEIDTAHRTFTVDGVDLARYITAAAIHLDAGNMPRVEVTIIARHVKYAGDAAVTVLVEELRTPEARP